MKFWSRIKNYFALLFGNWSRKLASPAGDIIPQQNPIEEDISKAQNEEASLFGNEGIQPEEGYDPDRHASALVNLESSEGITQRKRLTPLVFRRILPCWLIFTAIVVILQGLEILKLDSSETVAFLGTSFGQVVGLAYIVANYFFNPRKSQK